MKSKVGWLILSCLLVLSLLLASCKTPTSATVAPTSTPPTSNKTTAPTTIQTGEKTTTPATTGPEMVKITLKKLDGTTVEKMVEKPKYGGEFIVMRNTAILNWDDAYTPPWTNSGYLSAVQEELLEGDWSRGPDGTEEVTWYPGMWFDVNYSIGGLAESWEIQPPDTIIFHIRKGVRWSLNTSLEASRLAGGREFTADDAVYNIKRNFFDVKTSGIYGVASQSRPIEVSASDENTVVVKAAPGQLWFTFEYVGAWARMVPPEVAKKYGDTTDWTRANGVGPFMVNDYVAMSSATYIRNPNYWQKDKMFPENQLPYVDFVKLLIIPDRSSQMSAMRTGKVDLDNTLTLWEEAASYKKTSPDLKFQKWPQSTNTLLAGRQDKPDLPFKDINVRRALMMAINHEEIKNTYYGGEAIIYDYPVPNVREWAKAYTPLDQLGLAPDGFDTQKIYSYDVEGARQLLAQAGYPNGFKTEIILGTTSVDLASIVKDYWSKIGVDLALDVKETGVLNSMFQRKTYNQMAQYGYTTLGLAHNMDPNRTGNFYNYSMVADPEVDSRYNKMAAIEPRTDEWWAVVKDNLEYVIHRVNYTVPPRPYIWIFWQPWLKRYHGEADLGVSNANVFWSYIWIDQDLKKSMGH